MPTRVVRLHNIYGPEGTWTGGREKAPAALCRKVAEAVRDGQDAIDIWGDGEQTRSFCFIDDCVRGLRALMDSEHAQPINLGRSELVTINQLARCAMKAAGVQLDLVHIEGPQGVRGRNSDNTTLRSVLGWEPSVSLRDGIAATFGWIERQVRGG